MPEAASYVLVRLSRRVSMQQQGDADGWPCNIREMRAEIHTSAWIPRWVMGSQATIGKCQWKDMHQQGYLVGSSGNNREMLAESY